MKKVLSFILYFLIIIFIILVYGRFVATTGLNTNNIVINTTITSSYDGLKIIHFTDLHYKKVITEKRVLELVEEINKNNPDIVLFSGDLLDNDYKMTNEDTQFLINSLGKINSKYGNFAIVGDQDNKDEVQNIYIQSNFTLLYDETSIIYNENNDKISITGLGSYLNNDADIDNILNDFDNYSYNIFLIHEPDYIPVILDNINNIDLIVSGHSINGSINIPIIKKLLLPKGSKNYNIIANKINSTNIYISNGIGVNNVNFRLFNTPSINLYRIYNK